eukprot:TRINITY_DN26837_c0_g1_i2.p2 TRINITY_DN26837_c0_g1~~TRINITY_DN26837_c0_g1_i2.p2  ORF type:complete len:142 (+),score=49.19 TRINITY_DN26837_c0_g1_i2:72-497(+)
MCIRDRETLSAVGASLDPAKGEGRLRRLLAAAFEALPEHEKDPTHSTRMVFVLIMMSPREANIFDILGHALKASHDAGVPPGVKKAPGRSLWAGVHREWVEEHGALEPNPDKAACWEHWQDMSGLLDEAVMMLLNAMEGMR